MIAFHIAGRPVYRYGLFYGITFLIGYAFFAYIGKLPILREYPRLQQLLTKDLDLFIVLIIVAVLVGGRLGHVFLYEWAYYREHLGEILQVWQGGMSFVGGVIGVVMMLLGVGRYKKLSSREFMLLGDMILCVVPLGILLGRIGNFLNKELYGRVVFPDEILTENKGNEHVIFLPLKWRERGKHVGLLRNYGVDPLPVWRVNTNILQAVGEGLVPLVIGQIVWRKNLVRQQIRPGLISGLFFIIYAIVRWHMELLKDLPVQEYKGLLSISQRLMFAFFFFGIFLIWQSKKQKKAGLSRSQL